MGRKDPDRTIKTPPKPKRRNCQNIDCNMAAECRVSGHMWTGVHCSAHALGVVERQIFQVTRPGGNSIVIAPLPR